MKLTILLLRHGATSYNEKKQYLGWKDISLSKKGEAVLQKKRQLLKDISPKLLFVTPLARTKESATLLFPKQEQIVVEQWKEIDFGQWEGHTYEELKDDPIYCDWLQSKGRKKIPKGESKEEFSKRVVEGFLEILQNYVRDEELIVAVVHGGVIMSLLENWTKEEYYSFGVEPGEGYWCELEYDRTNQEPTLNFISYKAWKG